MPSYKAEVVLVSPLPLEVDSPACMRGKSGLLKQDIPVNEGVSKCRLADTLHGVTDIGNLLQTTLEYGRTNTADITATNP